MQPEIVKAGLHTHPLYKWFGLGEYGWLAAVLLIVVVGALAGFGRITAGWLGWTGVAASFLAAASLTVYRDGVRDLSLLDKGFDVWDRVVVTNWSVVGLFLVLFVASLGVVGWHVSVVARARKVMESAA